jgi:hypothetical protein
MITKALYLYEPELRRVKISFYIAGNLSALTFSRFEDIGVSCVEETETYWFRNYSAFSSCHLKISKRVFDYLTECIASHPQQDEIPF